MPATSAHPNATESMRHVASASNPAWADLGVWNIYQNPDKPGPQSTLESIVCGGNQNCSVDKGLALTIGQFKTPTLRDLVDSAPYFHDGSQATLEGAVMADIASSQLAHHGLLRNAAPEFANMHPSQDDVAALAAFLKSLTEDYDDA